jgi:hypothetical protein
LDHPQRTGFSFGLDEAIFVVTAVLVWYLVARWLSVIGQKRAVAVMTAGTVVRHLLVMALGSILLLHALTSLRSPGKLNNSLGSTIEGVLSLVWAGALLIAPLKSFFSALRAASTPERPLNNS